MVYINELYRYEWYRYELYLKPMERKVYFKTYGILFFRKDNLNDHEYSWGTNIYLLWLLLENTRS